MDYVDWCDHILNKIVDKAKLDTTVRSYGIYTEQILELISAGISQEQKPPDLDVISPLLDLEKAGLLTSENHRVWKLTGESRNYFSDKVAFWEIVCNTKLEQEHEQLTKELQYTKLAPGEVTRGELGFTVPKNETIKAIRFEDFSQKVTFPIP